MAFIKCVGQLLDSLGGARRLIKLCGKKAVSEGSRDRGVPGHDRSGLCPHIVALLACPKSKIEHHIPAPDISARRLLSDQRPPGRLRGNARRADHRH
jgi:hypothetical protein